MKQSEYDEECIKLDKMHGIEKQALAKQYALANKRFTVGSIISNQYCTIKVHKISYVGKSIFTKYPECYYTGPRLKKNNEEYKSCEIETIYESDIKKTS